jgi:hypothetical protein
MVEAMRGRGADARIVLYPRAYHYFDVIGQPRAYLAEVGQSQQAGWLLWRPRSPSIPARLPTRDTGSREFFGYHLKVR